MEKLKELLNRYSVAILVVAGLLLFWHGVQSYQHFQWLNVQDTATKGWVAIPSWRK